MKPHPRIRKTVKWGGAAATVLLVAAWIAGMWWDVAWFSRRHGFVDCGAGGFGVLYHQARKEDSTFAGWRVDAVTGPTRWWFDVTSIKSWSTWCSVTIPMWFPLALVVAITCLAWRLDTLARRRAMLNLCPKCHYDRTGLAPTAVCPECGTPA